MSIGNNGSRKLKMDFRAEQEEERNFKSQIHAQSEQITAVPITRVRCADAIAVIFIAGGLLTANVPIACYSIYNPGFRIAVAELDTCIGYIGHG